MCCTLSHPATARGGLRRCFVCPTDDGECVLARACEEGRVLITADKDFGELVVRLRRAAHGVVNLALGDLAAATRAPIAAARLRELGDRIAGSLVTIEPGRASIPCPVPGASAPTFP